MAEAVKGTIYLAKCNRTLLCRYKSEKLHVGSQYGITEVDYIPAACTECGEIITVNIRDPKNSDHCPTCKNKLHKYLRTGADDLQGENLCPRCQHNTLHFEVIGFLQ